MVDKRTVITLTGSSQYVLGRTQEYLTTKYDYVPFFSQKFNGFETGSYLCGIVEPSDIIILQDKFPCYDFHRFAINHDEQLLPYNLEIDKSNICSIKQIVDSYLKEHKIIPPPVNVDSAWKKLLSKISFLSGSGKAALF